MTMEKMTITLTMAQKILLRLLRLAWNIELKLSIYSFQFSINFQCFNFQLEYQ